MSNLFYSFGNQHPGRLVLNNYPRFLQELSIPGHPVLDLGAVDILRARERGVPRYNEFRHQLGLKRIRNFEDLTRDPDLIHALEQVYGKSAKGVEDLDLLIGTLAEDESVRPEHFGFGETLFQIFILNATRRLQADRFYTDCYNEDTYTKEGMDWIDGTDFKTVILRHHPELAHTGLANVKNAFEPWDTEPELDPKRHPLRAYDKDLKSAPWLGDRHRLPGADVVDYRGEKQKSKLFKRKLVLQYFNRGVFLRRPKGVRVGQQIEELLQGVSWLPGLGSWCRKQARVLGQIDVSRSDLETLAELRGGSGAIWVDLSGTDNLVLFDRDAIAQVLAKSPSHFGPTDGKLRGMNVFQPNGLTVTKDSREYDLRRASADDVLGFGTRVHDLAPHFLRIVGEEVEAVERSAEPDLLAWANVDDLCKRVAMRLTLGRWDPHTLGALETLMSDANVMAAVDSAPFRMVVRGFLAARDARAKPRRGLAPLAWPVDAVRGFFDRASTRKEFGELYTALNEVLSSPIQDSLVAKLAQQPDTQGVPKVSQIPHWIFALRGTLAVHTIYALALLAADQTTQDAVRDDLGGLTGGLDEALLGEKGQPDMNLDLLERCILEAGRLWPAVPLIVRQVKQDVGVTVGDTLVKLHKDQQVLIHNVANNRDEAQVGASPHAFNPNRWKRRGVDGSELQPLIDHVRHPATLFSDGRQTCPGRDLALLLTKRILGQLLRGHRYVLDGSGLDLQNLPVSYDQFEIVLRREALG
jgi:cytochrome P450